MSGSPAADDARQRIDRWLWHARIVRTRVDAAGLVRAGRVRLNGTRVTTAGHLVKIGDVLTVALDNNVRLLAVTGFAERRGSPDSARHLFEDRTAPSSGRPKPAA